MSVKNLVPIQLPADPTLALEAATKQYVDNKFGTATDFIDCYPNASYGVTVTDTTINCGTIRYSNGLTVDGSGRILVAKAGTYSVAAAIGIFFNAASGYQVFTIKQRRAAVVISTREGVVYGAANNEYAVCSLEGMFNALVGDVFCLDAYGQNASTTTVQNTRTAFTAQLISAATLPGPGGSWFTMRGSTNGFANTTSVPLHSLTLSGAPVGATVAVAASTCYVNTGGAGHISTSLGGTGITFPSNANPTMYLPGTNQYMTMPNFAIGIVTAANPIVTVFGYSSAGSCQVDQYSHVSAWIIPSGASNYPEAVHLIGGAGEPAFLSTWVNTGGGATPAHFYKRSPTEVVIAGAVKSGTIGTNFFILPLGYRPLTQVILPCMQQGALMGYITVNTDGNVGCSNGNSNDSRFHVSFRTDV